MVTSQHLPEDFIAAFENRSVQPLRADKCRKKLMAWSQRAMGTSLYIIIYRLRGSGDFERNHMVNFVEKVVVIHRGEKRKIVSRCGHVWCRSRRFVCILLVFFRRWGRLVMCDLIKHDALLWLVVFQQLWLVHFDPCWSVICSLGDPLSHGSPVVLFFDCGHPRFWNFYSTIPADVVRVKSYVNCLFDPAFVVIRVAVSEHAYNTGHKPL